MKKILLVNALYDPQLSQFGGIEKLGSFQTKGFMVPLNLATIAALTPDDIEVDLWDEPVHGRIDESTDLADYDLVGISCFVHRIPRAKEIAAIFRKRGIPVAIGGPGVSSAPEQCRDDFDILFIGEAELTWPQFISDFLAGNYKSEYRQIVKPELAISPIPRWDGLADSIKDYLLGAVQTTRGCPFDCEFCDVIYLFGRVLRTKPIDNVLEEICIFQRLGMHSIFFCDDSFIGNPRYTKDLLREVIALNRTFDRPLAFQTQLSINVARDEELLELLADANFSLVLIGIETPNKESLKETNKLLNYHSDLVEDCQKIMSYGIPIKGSMIVGFDHDDKNIFDEQFEFLQEACIPFPGLHILDAPDGTRLWSRFYKEGRIVSNESRSSYAGRRLGTNIIPKQMSRVELFEGFARLTEQALDWENFAIRMKGMISGVKRPPNVPTAFSDFSEADLDRILSLLKMAQKSGMMDTLLASGNGKKGLGLFKDFFLLDDAKARDAIFDIIRHTIRHAPFMLDKVMRLIVHQYGEYILLQPFLEAIHQQIEAEISGAFKPEVARGNIFLSDNFKKPYREIFPDIYKYVYIGLKNKTRTDEALIEVFTDFIVRWGQTFEPKVEAVGERSEQFEDFYRTFLFEIADRTIEKENKALEDESIVLLQDSDEEFPDFKRNRLADDILRYVGQELRSVLLKKTDDE